MGKSYNLLESDILTKSLTGIQGFDKITEDGLPNGRPTLIRGGTGCGKTLFAMEFVICSAPHYKDRENELHSTTY